jgi:hypothetical protein
MTAEKCNGIDDDCDGQIDEDFPQLGQQCSVGLGACQRFGTFACKADGTGVQCGATAGAMGTETCNYLDDDCNGKVDDGLPAIPCPNGGERYCVSGAYSECPRRCEVCVPGSQRECFTSFCTFWGTQTCASDGRSFGPCKESKSPAECQAVTDAAKGASAELEKCAIAQGLCAVDTFDLDGDGDKTEMLGRCDSVTCGP